MARAKPALEDGEIMTQAPNTAAVDEHLKEMVRALHAAINRALPHVSDDPVLVDKAIRDCKEILDVVIVGNVSEWIK